MTLLEEELKALESSADYRRVLRVYIKHQIYTLFQKLAEIGEDSFALTASTTDGTFSHVGSSKGEVFLDKTQDLQWKFLSFCSSSTDNQPDIFEESDVQQSIGLDKDHSPDNVYTEVAPTVRQVENFGAPEKRRRRKLSRTESTNDYGEQKYDEDCSYMEEEVEDVTERRGSTDGEDCVLPSSHPDDELAAVFYKRPAGATVDQGPPFEVLSSYKGLDGASVGQLPYSVNIKSEGVHVDLDNEDDEGNFSDVYSRNEQKMLNSGMIYTGVPIIRHTLQTSEEESENVTSTSFSQISEKQRDYLTGLLESERQCKFCAKFFATPSLLRNHVMTHTGERPFQCHMCNKSFNRNHHLMLHIRTHTGEKPFKCQICPKQFSQKGSRDRHQLTHFELTTVQENLP